MAGPQGTSLDITYRSLLRILIAGALAVALFQLREIIAAVMFAVVVASGIEPGVRWFARWRVPRIVAVLAIYLAAAVIIAAAIYLIVPSLLEEFRSFLDAFPSYQRILLRELRSFRELPFVSGLSEGAESIILNPPFDVWTLGWSTLDFLLGIFGGIVSGIVLVVVSFYLASQERGIERFLRTITPLQSEEYVLNLWSRAQEKIGQWLRGQLLLGLIVGILVYLALSILGVRYALILALLAAVFELVPIIGPILAAAPAVFFAFLSDPFFALIVAIVYVAIQQVESHLLVPLVTSRTVGLNPLVVVLALLAGAKLGGILGMFLAVPVAAVVVEFLVDTDRKKRGFFQFGGPEAR